MEPQTALEPFGFSGFRGWTPMVYKSKLSQVQNDMGEEKADWCQRKI